MVSKPKILVSGGTGFLGQFVVPLLRENFVVDVISRSAQSAVQGDLTRWNSGLSLADLAKNKYQIFIHLAGLYDLRASRSDCLMQNVVATNNALRLAQELQIANFINASSVAAVINTSSLKVDESELASEGSFPDAYSHSKALGEQAVRNPFYQFKTKLNLRLGILVGDTIHGRILRIDGPYQTPYHFNRLCRILESIPTALPLPGKSDTRIPLVPVDRAAKAIVKLCDYVLSQEANWSGQHFETLHLTPTEGLPILKLYESTLKNLFLKNHGVMLVESLPQNWLAQLTNRAFDFPIQELNYLLKLPRYSTKKITDILGADWCPEFAEYEKAFWMGYEKHISHS